MGMSAFQCEIPTTPTHIPHKTQPSPRVSGKFLMWKQNPFVDLSDIPIQFRKRTANHHANMRIRKLVPDCFDKWNLQNQIADAVILSYQQNLVNLGRIDIPGITMLSPNHTPEPAPQQLLTK